MAAFVKPAFVCESKSLSGACLKENGRCGHPRADPVVPLSQAVSLSIYLLAGSAAVLS